MSDARPVIKISPNPPVFDLPLLVALDHGLFDANGLDVRYSAEYSQAHEQEFDALKRLKESLFHTGSADAFNVCEWGSIDRIERGMDNGRIAALRPAIAAQAIVSFDPALQTPRDLADIEVGLNDSTGSHYTTLQLLDGAVGREHVKTVHIGSPGVRYDALKKGDIRAVTLMEPFISLALKEGAHIIALTFYRGAEVVAPHLTDIQRTAYFAAIDEAVDLINTDFRRYAHHVVKPTQGRLAPEELTTHFVRYTHVQQYGAEKFDQAYGWMRQRGLSQGNNSHDSLVIG